MYEHEKIKRRAHIRLIITEALMFLSVLVLVGFLTLVVMGYSFNLRELGGSGEVVERSGLVQISSIPTGATIYIDGSAPLFLSTNASRTMLAGEHQIELKRDGFDEWSKNVNVVEGMMYRLNYPRLFRIERESEDVLEYDIAPTAVFVSPNHERMVTIEAGSLFLVNLNDSTLVKKLIAVMDEKGVKILISEISGVEWSGNSERLLAKVNGKWMVINVRDEKASVVVDDLMIACDEKQQQVDVVSAEQSCAKVTPKDIEFETEAGDRLLVLTDKNELRELNIRDGKLSDLLVSDVVRFDNDGERVVYLTEPTEKDDAEDNKISEQEEAIDDKATAKGPVIAEVRAYRVGEENSYLVAELDDDGHEKTPSDYLIATMRYFQENYIMIAGKNGGGITILRKTGWINHDGDAEPFYDDDSLAGITSLKKRGRGMVLEVVDSDKKRAVFDIEAVKMTLIEDREGENGWIDEYLRYNIGEGGELKVRDYDGFNERGLVKKGVLTKRTVTISGNSKWLYYFVKNKDNTESLVRERVN